ncbi:hypothetical protein SmJEL517_g04129 [Synchytrium microbalum]|uniref:Aminotransferase class I/classII large domain-containing protein n=1 Tax=Synchytrium microbalum TaxID=1806994 RepID=A0A507C5G4_9FUNG|nr:uncharacterized protein SmJEL517_g04129 [Synchytrium microbalum]TPX32783.1 hypothetical protein SmJEL517_g04129 [Synchytrium microbalum]
MSDLSTISARAQGLVASQSYLGIGKVASINDPDIINLGTAENKLTSAEMSERMNVVRPVVTDQDLLYGQYNGHDALRRQLAHLLNRHFKPLQPVLIDEVQVTNGCASAINAIAQVCCDAGDCILLPSPYYGGFFNDTLYTARCELVPVPATSYNEFQVSVEDINATYQYATVSLAKRITAIIVCSPNNPLGRTYSKEWLEEVLNWAAERKLHVIVDELYALSVWGETAEPFSPFTSALAIKVPDPLRTHVLHGIAKDFLSNGLRMAWIVSRNPAIISALDKLGFFYSTSNLMQNWMCNMFSDHAWVDNFIKTNNLRIRDVYLKTTKWLTDHEIPFVEANSGFFIWIDLRRWLLPTGASSTSNASLTHSKSSSKPISTNSLSVKMASPATIGARRKEREIELFYALLQNKIYIAPGEAFYCDEEGWFRIIFAVEWPVLQEGLERMAKVLDDRLAKSFAGLNVD